MAVRRKSVARKSVAMVRFGALLLRVPRYLRLAYRIARDSRLTPNQRLLAVAGGAYMVSPVDPIPGFIPVVGQLDDLAVLLLTLRQALRGCPPEIAAEHLEQTGVTLAAIDADLATVRATTVWIVRTSGQVLGSALKGLGRVGRREAGRAMRGLLARRSAASSATDR